VNRLPAASSCTTSTAAQVLPLTGGQNHESPYSCRAPLETVKEVTRFRKWLPSPFGEFAGGPRLTRIGARTGHNQQCACRRPEAAAAQARPGLEGHRERLDARHDRGLGATGTLSTSVNRPLRTAAPMLRMMGARGYVGGKRKHSWQSPIARRPFRAITAHLAGDDLGSRRGAVRASGRHTRRPPAAAIVLGSHDFSFPIQEMMQA